MRSVPTVPELRPPKPPKQAKPPKLTTMPKPPRYAYRSTGPKGLRLTSRPEAKDSPWPAPEAFATATTSDLEWLVWWGFFKAFNEPGDPREYGERHGYFGGPSGLWRYQKAFEGGRRELGGSVLDYVLYPGSAHEIWVWIQSEAYHTIGRSMLGLEQHVYDVNQMFRNSRHAQTVAIWEQHILPDRSGAAVVRACKDAARGVSWASPLAGNTPYRVRL